MFKYRTDKPPTDNGGNYVIVKKVTFTLIPTFLSTKYLLGYIKYMGRKMLCFLFYALQKKKRNLRKGKKLISRIYCMSVFLPYKIKSLIKYIAL